MRAAKDGFVSSSFFFSLVISSTRFSALPSFLHRCASSSRAEIAVGIGARTSDMSTVAACTSCTHCSAVQLPPALAPALPLRFGTALPLPPFRRFASGATADAAPPSPSRGRFARVAAAVFLAAASSSAAARRSTVAPADG